MKSNFMERAIIRTRLSEAYDAYCNGQEPKAAELNREAAEMAAAIGEKDLEQHARRWQGNSLMWSGRYEEAFRVLTMAASYDHPDADPGAVYGAKTDRILLSLSIAPAAFCRELLLDGRAYLARVAKPHWSHRLEMLEGILHYRQGDYTRAAEFAGRAIRLVEPCMDGPCYAKSAHVKWVTRPLFHTRQVDAILQWNEQTGRDAGHMISDRLRQGCVRMLALRLERANGEDVEDALRAEARNITVIALNMRGIWDEVFEVGRALMLTGDWDTLDRLPVGKLCPLPFEHALYAADCAINCLRRKCNLPAWDGDLDWPHATPLTANGAAIEETDLLSLRNALAKLSEEAAREDQRMETKICALATQRRVEHVATLLPGIDWGRGGGG